MVDFTKGERIDPRVFYQGESILRGKKIDPRCSIKEKS